MEISRDFGRNRCFAAMSTTNTCIRKVSATLAEQAANQRQHLVRGSERLEVLPMKPWGKRHKMQSHYSERHQRKATGTTRETTRTFTDKTKRQADSPTIYGTGAWSTSCRYFKVQSHELCLFFPRALTSSKFGSTGTKTPHHSNGQSNDNMPSINGVRADKHSATTTTCTETWYTRRG